jgi:hypothetical protein
VTIRPLSKSNYDVAAKLYAETTRWQFYTVPPVDSSMFVSVLTAPTSCFYELVNKEDKFVGLGGLENIKWIDKTAEPVIAITRDLRGTPRVATKFADSLFETLPKKLGIHRVHSIVLQDSPSVPLLKHLGFTCEGTLERLCRCRHIRTPVRGGITMGGGGGGGNEPREISNIAREFQGGLTAAGMPLIQQGFAQLGDILGREGRTAPQFFERQLRGIERGTESALQSQAQRSAQQGFRGPGQDAILQAIRSAGAQQQGDVRAREAMMAEQRQRSDLSNLLGGLVISPLTSLTGAEFGAPMAPREPSMLETVLGGLGGAAGGAGSIMTGIGAI